MWNTLTLNIYVLLKHNKYLNICTYLSSTLPNTLFISKIKMSSETNIHAYVDYLFFHMTLNKKLITYNVSHIVFPILLRLWHSCFFMVFSFFTAFTTDPVDDKLFKTVRVMRKHEKVHESTKSQWTNFL